MVKYGFFTAALLSFPLIAQAEVTGNLNLTSNYTWRGISQTDNDPALQGGITYNHSTGFYAGVWGSNVRFKNVSNPALNDNFYDAHLELDYSLGYASKFANGLAYDVGVARYTYPSSSTNFNYNEVHVTANYSFLTATIAYSNNAFNTGKNGTYYNLGTEYGVPFQSIKDVKIYGSVGRYVLDPETGFNSYVDYKIGVKKKFLSRYQASLEWVDTNGKFNNPALPTDQNHLVASLSVDI